MKVVFKLEGAKELDDLLKRFPGRVAGRVAANSLRAGGRIIRDAAKINVQATTETGELKKSIKVITGRTATRDSRIVHVGVFGKQSRLAHIIEFGTVPVRKAKGDGFMYFTINGRFIKKRTVAGVKAHPFLRSAADSRIGDVVQTIGRVLGDGIEKEALKLGKRR